MLSKSIHPIKGNDSGGSQSTNRTVSANQFALNTDVTATLNSESGSSYEEFLTRMVNDVSIVPRLHEDLLVLEERVEAIERQEGRLQEMEAAEAAIDDIRLGLHMLVANVVSLEKQVDDIATKQSVDHDRMKLIEEELTAEQARNECLEDRIAALEDLFSPRLVEKQEAHVAAQEQDPSEILSVGDRREIWIDETHFDGPEAKAVGRIEGLVTFIHFEARSPDVSENDTIEVYITDRQDTCAHARPAFEVDTDAHAKTNSEVTSDE